MNSSDYQIEVTYKSRDLKYNTINMTKELKDL